MQHLWAPWRGEYIEQGEADGCIFCDEPRKGDDRTRHILHRAETCFSMLNRFPYNGGHLLVAPFRHLAALADLQPRELAGLFELVRDSVSLLARVLSPDGFNIGINLGRAAGAGVADHLHVHVVPRWAGDTNFMPALGETKVISHSLDEMYRRLTSS